MGRRKAEIVLVEWSNLVRADRGRDDVRHAAGMEHIDHFGRSLQRPETFTAGRRRPSDR